MNNDKKPFNDPRVRRAMQLVFDRPVLVDVVKDVAPMLVGGFIYPLSDWATPDDEMSKGSGKQKYPKASIQGARRLMAEASYPNGLKNKDGPQNYSRWSNKACHDLVKHIDRELATEKRKAIARQAEMLMEQDPPLLPVSWEKINGS